MSELRKELLLRYADYSKPFYIDVDASMCGVGGLLYQENGPIVEYFMELSLIMEPQIGNS